jgi:hypothetical protein
MQIAKNRFAIRSRFWWINTRFSQDENIKGNGVANEGIVSTRLGLKGHTKSCEELQIARNLFLLEYTGGKLHRPFQPKNQYS